MMLTDEQVERYSRQLILPEVGPGGQERLAAARVAVVGDGVAAERVVGYLAAAGVGWIAAAPALHHAVDPEQPDLIVAPLAAHVTLDAVVVTDPRIEEAAAAVAAWRPRAAMVLWIAAGRAGGVPPCPSCAAVAAASGGVPTELAAPADALLGTVVATEVVKALLAIGVPFAGRVLAYDPETATVTSSTVAARPECACRTAAI